MNIEKLKGAIPDSVYIKLPSVIEKFEINTTLRLAHFLSQCSHESMGFKVTSENLNYSSEGLLKTFGKYFTPKTAILYARKPEKIANIVYADRMGNDDEESGEGYKFRGRGFLQTTGKEQYELLSKYFDVDFIKNPELISSEYALLSAGYYFMKNNLLAICDLGTTDEVITKLTRKINGGLNGISDRIKLFKFFYKLLNK